MTRPYLRTLLFLCLAQHAHATAQLPDRLIVDGQRATIICSYPLEEYFETYPERHPEAAVTWTNLWRGYVATFEISNGLLTVADIVINPGGDNQISVLDEVFPSPEDRKLTWFSGNIDIAETVPSDGSDKGRFVTHHKTLELNAGELVQTTTFWTEEQDHEPNYVCA